MKLGAVKANGMMKLCPNSTCGFILLMYTHSQLTHSPTILCITSSHTLPLCIIPGSSLRGGGIFDPALLQALGRTQEGSIVGWFPRECCHRYKARGPARPPHAASPNHPSRQLTPCCLRGICSTAWAALPLPLPYYCLCIVYILYIYI